MSSYRQKVAFTASIRDGRTPICYVARMMMPSLLLLFVLLRTIQGGLCFSPSSSLRPNPYKIKQKLPDKLLAVADEESTIAATAPSPSAATSNTAADYCSSSRLPDDLVDALDLRAVIELVAAHCGTYRGRQALLRLVGSEDNAEKVRITNKNTHMTSKKKQTQQYYSSSRQRQLLFASKWENDAVDNDSAGDYDTMKPLQRHQKRQRHGSIAASAEEAAAAYQNVAQASQAIQSGHVPPLYHPTVESGDSGPLDTSTIPTTDDDEWLYFSDDDFSLENVLQAEQVILKLLNVFQWAEQHQELYPGLANIILEEMKQQVVVDELKAVYAEVKDAVEIVRVRTVMDPSARSTFQFRLKETKFPVLRVLRKRLQELQDTMRSRSSSPSSDQQQWGKLELQLTDIKEEIGVKENEIQLGLVHAICSVRQQIDDGLNAVARLDVVFSKAAFGQVMEGCIVNVKNESRGQIFVENFVHPLLQHRADRGRSSSDGKAPVPIDLKLGRKQECSTRALIISGSNGGGKTTVLKSFGLVSVLSKLAIPINSGKSAPIVDFFDETIVSIGDYQNIESDQSTYTSQLRRYSSILEKVASSNDTTRSKSYLVLLDELGSGTEEHAGGAIGQAVLEKLLENESCRVVATTHSPLLKTFSFNRDDRIGCAAVQLQRKSTETKYQLPSYRLEYGCIGESNAFGAASQILPDNVLERASDIVNQSTVGANEPGRGADASFAYLRALTESLEFKATRTAHYLFAAKEQAEDIRMIRKSMIRLASAYDRHLAQLEQRVEQCYQTVMKQEGGSSIVLLGETLSELRTVQKTIKSEVDILRERGLKPLPVQYDLREGETVVIVDSDSEWDGCSGSVVSVDSSSTTPDDRLPSSRSIGSPVAVKMSAWGEILPTASEIGSEPVAFQRHQLAVWDYESILDDDFDGFETTPSIQDSKRKLSSLLATLKSNENTKTTVSHQYDKDKSKTFTSSRERKAARKKRKKGGSK